MARECECYLQEVMRRKLKFANIPELFKDLELSKFDVMVYQQAESRQIVRTACKIIKTYLDNFTTMQERGMGLYIYSKTRGSGKTYISAMIANELMKKHQVKFAGSTVILNEIRTTYEKNKDKEYTENQLLDALVTTEILVIDDFGTERVTDWVNDKFYHIINQRYLKKKVTLYTSNDSIRTLDYDSRITSRIMERVYEVKFAEESVREHIAENNEKEIIEMIQR